MNAWMQTVTVVMTTQHAQTPMEVISARATRPLQETEGAALVSGQTYVIRSPTEKNK